MKKSIRVKKAFTLIELMLVIILISTVSFLVATNFNFNTQEKYKVNIGNIKDFLSKKFKFSEKISLTCIEDESLNCYVFIDGVKNKEIKIENLFTQLPQVYNYDKDLSEYQFTKVRLNDIEYEPFFQLIIDNDGKHKNIVLDTMDEKVYLFSSISKKTEVFENTNEIIDRFFELETEVKDAL